MIFYSLGYGNIHCEFPRVSYFTMFSKLVWKKKNCCFIKSHCSVWKKKKVSCGKAFKELVSQASVIKYIACICNPLCQFHGPHCSQLPFPRVGTWSHNSQQSIPAIHSQLIKYIRWNSFTTPRFSYMSSQRKKPVI